MQEAKFIILEQAFLEALHAGDSAAALACLREQLAPLGVNPERLHQLAACLMCGAGPAALPQPSGWQGEPPCDARHQVLRRLQVVIPPEVMLPERRLEELVEQALVAQIDACCFHNTPAARPSLLSDYTCGTEQIPTCTTQVRPLGWAHTGVAAQQRCSSQSSRTASSLSSRSSRRCPSTLSPGPCAPAGTSEPQR